MAGAMRKMGEYLGLVEQADYDEYDDEPTSAVPARREEERRPAAPVRAVEKRAQVASIDEHRRAPRAVEPVPSSGLARIETVTPRTYNDARTVGEHYRSGVPVIMNLSEIDDEDAKRLVDFAAGLVFAVHGTINRVTAKVFLLSPEDVEVSAEDRQRIVAGGFYDHG